jgi:hypothetical protein
MNERINPGYPGEIDAILGDMFLARGEGGWNRKGETIPEDLKLTAAEGTQRVGMDFGIETVVTTALVDGEQVEIPGQRAIFRGPVPSDPNKRFLGMVSDTFTPLTNMDIATALDASGVPAEWPLETIGTLEDGRQAFWTFRLPVVGVGGEDLARYLSVIAGHDGKNGVRTMLNMTRIVCRNTSRFADAEAKIKITLKHGPSVKADFALAVDLVAAVKRSAASMQSQLDRIAAFKVTQDQVQAIVEAAYPTPKEVGGRAQLEKIIGSEKFLLLPSDRQAQLRRAQYVSEQATARAMERRKAAVLNYERICGDSALLKVDLRGTAWAAYNAVTEIENWRVSRGQSDSDAFESILIGDRGKAMDGAYAAALSLTK